MKILQMLLVATSKKSVSPLVHAGWRKNGRWARECHVVEKWIFALILLQASSQSIVGGRVAGILGQGRGLQGPGSAYTHLETFN